MLKIKIKRIIKFIGISGFTVISIFLLMFSYGYGFVYPDTANPGQDSLDQIKTEKEETRKKIEQAQKEQDAYSEQVQEVETKLLSSLSELDELKKKENQVKQKMDNTTILLVQNENDIAQLESELKEKSDILNSRIAEIYKRDSRDIINIFLKSEDFIEFVSRFKLMSLLLKEDTDAIAEIKDKKAKLLVLNKGILSLRDEQKNEKEEIDKLIEMSVNKKREIENIYNEKVELFSQAKANKDALIAMENQLAAKETEVTNILKDYKQGQAPTGKLLWPANGKISSNFGPRTSSSTGRTRMHNGMDIYAPLGTPVIAADSGQILKAGYDGGYGYSILLYHGGGVATVYAHLSGFNVNAGQFVEKGQIIGYVGNTGFTTGYHLHFEVRINGQSRNPANYL
ncbi:MAG: peptidoglycan DD-metalloendopeptidase family protein [Actinobacteria bacterium]|nr:peptidoglycan DD-metalloendopeptidase family protein [Actinomycetota bacterium]